MDVDLEIRHLQLVAAVADVGTLTRAGDRLHLTQSALSHQLRDIESRLGAPLFLRVGKRLVLTPAGERLLVSAREVLQRLEPNTRSGRWAATAPGCCASRRSATPAITGCRSCWRAIGAASHASSAAMGSLAQRAQRVLDERINPAVAGHEGRISLEQATGNSITVRLEGRCQGCAMASVTLRQGVEVILKDALPDLLSVADATDHQAGVNPFFKTKKGSK